MKVVVKHKPEKCPQCGSAPVADIMYGLPNYFSDLEADIEAGRIVLGGCCPEIGDPKWACAGCGAKFVRVEDEEKAISLRDQFRDV